MITIRKERNSSKNNPLGNEAVEIAMQRLDELDGQVQGVKSLVKDLVCTNSEHADSANEIILTEDGKSVHVNACCDTFTQTIEKTIGG